MHDDTISTTCRICLGSTIEDLVSPCRCCGSMQYVHNDCLARWIHSKSKYAFIGTKSGYSKCEVCGHAMEYNVQGDYISSYSSRIVVSILTLLVLLIGITITGILGCFSSYVLSQDQKFREGIVYCRDLLGKYDKNLDSGPVCYRSWNNYVVVPMTGHTLESPIRIVQETATQSIVMNITTPKSPLEFEEMVLLMNEINFTVHMAQISASNREREFQNLKEKGGRFWLDRAMFWRFNLLVFLDTLAFGFCFYSGLFLTVVARRRTSQFLFGVGFLLHVVLFTIKASRRTQIHDSIVYSDISSFFRNLNGEDINELTQGWTTLTLVVTSKLPLLRGMYKSIEQYVFNAMIAANWRQRFLRLGLMERYEDHSQLPAKIIFEDVSFNHCTCK